jgi:hypothetical protein
LEIQRDLFAPRFIAKNPSRPLQQFRAHVIEPISNYHRSDHQRLGVGQASRLSQIQFSRSSRSAS